VADVMARRLESPLDSMLRLTDANGKELAFNDDYDDKGDGLHTHHADSYLRFTLPADGAYYVFLGDAQGQGGPEYAYRLRLGTPRPDFALRVVPSTVSVRGGMAVPLTVYALRQDGCTNTISVVLKGAPPGFALSGAELTPGHDQARITLTAPTSGAERVFKLVLEGRSFVQSKTVVHPVVPADDKMQAFLYRHLVPSEEMELTVLDRPQLAVALKILDPMPVKIPAGGTARVRVRVPARAVNNYQLELSDPPPGIALLEVAPGDGETTLSFHCDAAKLKSGTTGNLIVNIVAKRSRPNGGGKGRGNQAQFVIGALPAIPFEIAPAQIAAK
jgi:hypothetical protein